MRVMQTSPFHVLTCEDVDTAGSVVMSFDPALPVAVSFKFTAAFGEVEWEFARDLIAAGLVDTEGAGHGDVRVWADPSGQDFVYINLSAPQGECLVRMLASSVMFFLGSCEARVPAGSDAEVEILAEWVDGFLREVYAQS